MAEPRSRPRQKGQLFTTPDLTELLYAFGSNPTSTGGQLGATIAVLDEILTDFIIESCHSAAICASYSRRQKIKVDDFKWVLRKDERLLGRVLEQMWKDREMKDTRRVMDFDKVGAEGAGDLADIAEIGGATGEMKKKGRRKKRKAEDDAGGDRKRLES